MKMRFVEFLDSLRGSFWFIPSLMTVGAAALAFGTVHLDDILKEKVLARIGILYTGGAEGARSVLSSIAGSMITVAGVVFSVMVVMLSLASQQFGPRILRTYIRDRANQIVLGSFVSTFVYCLSVLRTIRSGDSAAFVPYISVTTGILFAVLSMGVLIFFVHHAAESIESSTIIQSVSGELKGAIDRLYPTRIGEGNAPDNDPEPEPEGAPEICSRSSGYVQFVDGDKLVRVAEKRDFVIVVVANPGTFVRTGDPLAKVVAVEDKARGAEKVILDAFRIGANRTPTQDVELLFRQIAEIGVRALSAGINDPFTALETLDRLGDTLTDLAEREIPSKFRRGKTGKVRVVAHQTSFPRIADISLGAIREYAATHEQVLSGLLLTIRRTAPHVRRPEDRAALQDQASRVLPFLDAWQDDRAIERIRREVGETLAALSLTR